MAAISLPRALVLGRLSERFDVLFWFALAAILTAGWVFRLTLTLSTDFPLHDGGLFYVMIENIRHSHYLLPSFTSFNGTEIPFAYPPLAFYVAAAIADLTGLPALDVLRVLPSVVSGAVLLAFFALARSFLGSKAAVIVAVLAFALLPSSFSYLIVGAGLAKSFGLLFALLALSSAYQMYRRPTRAAAAPVIVLGALSLLSHIEMAWFLAFSIGALFIAYGRSREGLKTSVLVALGVLALTAPWWGLVLHRHGLSPFLAASQVGSSMSSAATTDSALLVITVGLVALFTCIVMLALPDRRFALLGWLGLIVALDTRNFAWLPTIPLTLALGAIVGEGLIPRVLRKPDPSPSAAPAVALAATRSVSPVGEHLASSLVIVVVVAALAAMNLGNSTLDNFGNVNLSQNDRTAMEWARQETAPSSRFLVLSGLPQWSADSISEWFPALAERTSVVTPQGSEWFPGGEFLRLLQAHATAQACGAADGACLDRWSDESGVAVSHVYLAKRPGGACCPVISAALSTDSGYTAIYDGLGATIFARVAADTSPRREPR